MSTRDCDRCHADKKSGGRCTRRTCAYGTYCWQHSRSLLNLRIKKSGIPGAGNGLFTTIDRRKGDTVAEYTGKVVPASKFLDDKYKSAYGYQVDKNTVIDAKSTQSALGRYANDCRSRARGCKTNNAKFAKHKRRGKWSVRLKAKRNIKKGEEVFVSYGRSYWRK